MNRRIHSLGIYAQKVMDVWWAGFFTGQLLGRRVLHYLHELGGSVRYPPRHLQHLPAGQSGKPRAEPIRQVKSFFYCVLGRAFFALGRLFLFVDPSPPPGSVSSCYPCDTFVTGQQGLLGA